jgi:hypothetical protein
MCGNRNTAGRFPFQTTDTAGGLYGAGRFTYSTNQFSSSFSSSAAGYTSGSALWSEVNFDSALSASVAAGQVKKVVVPTSASIMANFDAEAVSGFVLTSG